LVNNKLNKFRINKKSDYVLSLAIFALVIFGLIMVSSASVIKSYEATDGASNYYYLIRQFINVGIGIIFWLIFQAIDYRKWKKYAIWFFLISLFLTFLVFIPGIGQKIGGATRWIGFGSYAFQPSELLKLSFIIFLASYFDNIQENIENFFKGLLPFLFILGVIVFILMNQPDMGTAMIFVLISLGMFFIAGANLWQFLSLLPIGGIIFWVLIKSSPYRMARFMTFLNPSADSLGKSYHVNQSLIAIGSGGWWGQGFGNSHQKYNFLPEPMTDSVFAVAAEELGFLRSFLIIAAFALIAWRGFLIAKNAADNFGKYLASGIVLWIVFQAFINLAAMLGIIPLTGVPLPFVSYGGSSLIILLSASGILLNISKSAKN